MNAEISIVINKLHNKRVSFYTRIVANGKVSDQQINKHEAKSTIAYLGLKYYCVAYEYKSKQGILIRYKRGWA